MAARALLLSGVLGISRVAPQRAALPVRIDGTWYNMASWADAHPGGKWLLQYAEGKDVSALFHSIHLRSSSRADEILSRMPKMDLAEQTPFVFHRDLAQSDDGHVGEITLPQLRKSEFATDLQALMDEEFPTPESAKATPGHWLRIFLSMTMAVWCWSEWAQGSLVGIALLPLCQWL